MTFQKMPIRPKKIAVIEIRITYWYIVLLPSMFLITTIEEAFVAGPAIRKTKIAPADTPFPISATAIGIDAVAQT